MTIQQRIMALGLAACLAGGAVVAHAQSQAQLNSVKAAVKKALGADAPVKSVSSTPLPGIYEVDVGSQILYSDEKGHYMFMGELIDAQTRTNLTQARLAELNKIDFASLPFDHAIKYVKGNGSRKIAVFSDPNCPYCKRLEETLKTSSVNNVTVYTFLFPVLSPDSTVKSKAIWCSSDRLKAWHEWMLDAQAPSLAAANCSTPLDENRALGAKLKVTGTPTIFLADGSRLPGAVSSDQLEKALASVK